MIMCWGAEAPLFLCLVGNLNEQYRRKEMDGIQTEGFVQQSRELDHLMMSNPDMENMVRRLIRKVIA